MYYDTTEDFIRAELERAGLPTSDHFIRAARAEDRPTIEANVKAMTEALAAASPFAKENAAIAELQARLSKAEEAGDADLALVLRGRLQGLMARRNR